jgi:ligand-binding sensor domain-containing protein/tRNA A-37 threonylcarbamoyl transferase component Bud32
MKQLQAGQNIGPYRIINQVGQGGMATVYKAYHAAMDRYVALKVISTEMADNEALRGRFQQEARLIASLEHPHILPVHDFGESDGIYYLAMRFLDTGTLKDRILSKPLSLAEVDHLFSQLAGALGYAHEQGILHRDIKPSNVMLNNRGDVFLTDFGIAKLMEGPTQFTVTGTITGTPAYMSPEQASGEKLDPRSDIYSLGIVLYEMITGRVPFEAETPLAVILKHLQAPLPLPSTIKADVPDQVERVLLKALAKDRKDRYASCQEFLAAWKLAYQGGSSPARPADQMTAPLLPSAPPAATLRNAAQPTESETPAVPTFHRHTTAGELPTVVEKPTARPAGIGWLAWAAGGLFVLALLAFGGWAVWNFSLRTQSADIEQEQVKTGEAQPVTSALDVTQAGFESWSSANRIQGIEIFGDQVYTYGPGGITIWQRSDGTILRRITTADGLPGANVMALHVESESVLWVGTDQGLARLDQNGVTLYTTDDGLDSDYISAIVRLEDGRLVVGTQYSDRDGGGINIYDGSAWQIETDFPSMHPDARDENHVSNAVNVLLADGSNLWAGTSGGLAAFDGTEWRQYHREDGLPDEDIFSLWAASGGRLLIGTRSGAATFDGASIVKADQSPPDGAYGVLESPENVFWQSGGGGIWRFDANHSDWQVFEYTELPEYGMMAGNTDENGQIYFGTDRSGLVVFNPEMEISYWRVPDVPHGTSFGKILQVREDSLMFPDNSASFVDVFDLQREEWAANEPDLSGTPIFYDRQGRLWMNEWPSGVWILAEDGTETHITDRQGLPAEAFVNAVAPVDAVETWLATSQGLILFDGTKISEIIPGIQAGLPEDEVWDVFLASDGALWVRSYYGLARRSPEGDWETFSTNSPFRVDGTQVNDITEDGSGNVWLATSAGVYKYRAGEWDYFTRGDPQVKLPSEEILCITIAPDGVMWFGTMNGAARWDGETWQEIETGHNGLISGTVYDIFALANGEVFFATEGGVTRLKP